jgi:hypothetical protein
MDKRITDSKQQINIFINYILFFGIGLQGIYSFFGHLLMTAEVAKSIGWAPAPQFQIELAFSNLAVGILAILAVWKPQLQLVSIVVATVFLWDALIVILLRSGGKQRS